MSSIVTWSNPRSLKSWIAFSNIRPRSLFFFSARKPISRHMLLQLVVPSHDERRVVPAERERVAERRADLLAATRVRHVVEIALGVRRVVVHRRRHHAAPHRETAD